MDRGDICGRYLDTLTFDPYPFQEEALLAWFESDGGVLVSAPTGMGKTLIAEAAVFEALHTGRHLFYTTPLIALTDQKYREFQRKVEDWGFPRSKVGLVTGNRRDNPDAPILIVVAEILLNYLLADDPRVRSDGAVVMDEFHYFNDLERGIVWELSLVMLPAHLRLMLLSATVGNTVGFIQWLREHHGRTLRLVQSSERRVPLDFHWVGDRLITEHLPAMIAPGDADNRTPALVFCFNRDECWDVAERLKGIDLIDTAARAQIEPCVSGDDFAVGAGPKLRQMLIRGVGVHHAGIMPRYKEVIEDLFHRKLIPFVICTETLAAGINLPARSVVLTTLLKGKPGEKKLVAPSSAHQMFGRAGRPQFDSRGYVYALAHEDDVRIVKWKEKYEKIDPRSKDPGIMRARKDLERKRPTRRSNEQYWTEGQFQTLIKAGPANLVSRSMIPYQVLVFLLNKTGSVREARGFLTKRFTTPNEISRFNEQLTHMVENLAVFGFVRKAADGDHVELAESIRELLTFRSVDPLYGAFLVQMLPRTTLEEKIAVLESVLPFPPNMLRNVRLHPHEPGAFEVNELDPLMLQMGLVGAKLPEHLQSLDDVGDATSDDNPYADWVDENEKERRLTLPEKLRLVFEAKLATPEEVLAQSKWVAGGIFEMNDEFYRFVRDRELVKNEGLVLRHLLRLVILSGEFFAHTDDPLYRELADRVTKICAAVDARYTEKFLAEEIARARLLSEGTASP